MPIFFHDGQGCCGGSSGSKASATPASADAQTADGSSNGGCCGGSAGSCSSSSCCGGSSKSRVLAPMTRDQIQALSNFDLVIRFRRGIECIDPRVFQLSERQIDQAFLPELGVGRWPVRVLIGHIADATIANIHRARRIAAEDGAVLQAWDEDAFIDANVYGHAHTDYAQDPEGDENRVTNALGGPMAVIHTLRQWTGQWLLTLNDTTWERSGMHTQRGPLTLRDVIVGEVAHLEHHAGFLTRKLDRLLGPAATQAPTQAATPAPTPAGAAR